MVLVTVPDVGSKLQPGVLATAAVGVATIATAAASAAANALVELFTVMRRLLSRF